MPSLAAARAANAAFSRLPYLPVAIFVGATSGIGQATAEAFARYTKGNAHIVLIGRNQAAADAILASFPAPTAPGATHEFVPCDVSLMKNVHATTSALAARLPKLNYLVLSPGLFNFRGRDETAEGIDRRLALHYYTRWKFIHDLVPLLQKARDAGEDAKALSVLGAGYGGKIDLQDLGMKKSYSLSRAGLTSPTYTDLMIQSFAERHPDIAFIHTSPGAVRTPILQNSYPMLGPITTAFTYLTYPLMTSPADCAEYTLYALSQSAKGPSRRDRKGDDIGMTRYYGSEEAKRAVWEHTEAEFARALAVPASS